MKKKAKHIIDYVLKQVKNRLYDHGTDTIYIQDDVKLLDGEISINFIVFYSDECITCFSYDSSDYFQEIEDLKLNDLLKVIDYLVNWLENN